MVFRDRRKQKGRPNPPTPKWAQITDLPTELVLDIVQDMTVHEILQFRLVHPQLTTVANDALRQRISRLYLHSSRKSLSTAVEICNHPLFSQMIDELVILRIVPLWPPCYPRSGSLFGFGAREQPATRAAGPCFFDKYEPLLNALAKLPLKKLVFSEQFTSPSGLNMVSGAKSATMSETDERNRYGDGYVLLALLDSLPKAMNSRTSIEELHVLIPPIIRSSQVSPNHTSTIPGLKVVTLTLDSDAQGGRITEWGIWVSSFLNHAANLEELTLNFEAVWRTKHVVGQMIMSRLLRKKAWPRLQKLNLRLRDQNVEHAKLPRPALSEDHHSSGVMTLQHFLTRHTNLKTLHLDNVLFYDAEALNAVEATKAICQAVRTASRKSPINFTWKINRFQHHPWCKRKTRLDDLSLCKHGCGVYSAGLPGFTSTSSVEHFERLAVDMGVELEEERFWDFGKGAMPELEM